MTRRRRVRTRTRARRSDVRVLTREQRDELTLGFGQLPPDEDVTFFSSVKQARGAWRLHGPGIMAMWTRPYRRPNGWWRHEKSEPVPCDHFTRLVELDALTLAEKRQLEEDRKSDQLPSVRR